MDGVSKVIKRVIKLYNGGVGEGGRSCLEEFNPPAGVSLVQVAPGWFFFFFNSKFPSVGKKIWINSICAILPFPFLIILPGLLCYRIKTSSPRRFLTGTCRPPSQSCATTEDQTPFFPTLQPNMWSQQSLSGVISPLGSQITEKPNFCLSTGKEAWDQGRQIPWWSIFLGVMEEIHKKINQQTTK